MTICTNLKDKKLMLKNYAGKKILQIQEKTTVEFVSVASSIYHCSFFLYRPVVMSDVDPLCPSAACPRFPGLYCLWLPPSVFNLVKLHSAVMLKHCRAGQNPSWGWGYCFPSGCCHSERGMVCLSTMAVAIWG